MMTTAIERLALGTVLAHWDSSQPYDYLICDESLTGGSVIFRTPPRLQSPEDQRSLIEATYQQVQDLLAPYELLLTEVLMSDGLPEELQVKVAALLLKFTTPSAKDASVEIALDEFIWKHKRSSEIMLDKVASIESVALRICAMAKLRKECPNV